MSFSRFSFCGLALAAGLAAPASAATTKWTIEFFEDTLGSVGLGEFEVVEPPVDSSAPISPWNFGFLLGPTADPSVFNYVFSNLTVDSAASGPTFFPAQNTVPSFPTLVGSQLKGTGPGNPQLSLNFNSVFGFWTISTGACDEVVTLNFDKVNFLEDAPPTCQDSWSGSYAMVRQTDPVDPGDPSVIPLPATAALLPLGLVALGAIRRRKAKG